MESINRITDDAMESAKYGLQMTQSENGRLKADRPPAQVTLYVFKVHAPICNTGKRVR